MLIGVKLYCAPMAKTIADRAMQVLGGNGYVAEYNVSITNNICMSIITGLFMHKVSIFICICAFVSAF